MSADTLTDAEARVLRQAADGHEFVGLRTVMVSPMFARGLYDVSGSIPNGPFVLTLTPAGREALARHEATEGGAR